jgi:selenoprotein W-related protein
VDPELVASGGGVFDVDADGRRIFSKHETGRFPEADEILERLKG